MAFTFIDKANGQDVGATSFSKHHKLTLVMGHSHTAQEVDPMTLKKEKQILPSWAFDYDYIFHENWGIGLHNDIIIQTFKIQESDGSYIERSFPISTVVVGSYKVDEHWSFQLGMGGEFAKEANFVLTRVGIEYGWELPNNMELSGVLNYDAKWYAYDTYMLGIGIAKIFR